MPVQGQKKVEFIRLGLEAQGLKQRGDQLGLGTVDDDHQQEGTRVGATSSNNDNRRQVWHSCEDMRLPEARHKRRCTERCIRE